MPELPEVEALALDLKGRLDGHAIARVHLAAFSALKTFDPPVQALEGTLVDDVTRHGKFLDIEASGLHLVFHLARAGWIRWRDELPTVPPRPSSKSPLAVRVVLDDESGLDVTEAGTKKSLAMYVVRVTARRARHRQPRARPARRRLHPRHPRPASCEDAGRSQIKGVLRHQGTIAGIGNAYTDEILHAAKMSPFKPANSLTADELDQLFAAIKDVLGDAVERSRGPGRQRAQGREEDPPRGARPHRREVPGLRRHRARGQLRRLHPAVLPDLPDRRQAAGRPPDVPSAEVGAMEIPTAAVDGVPDPLPEGLLVLDVREDDEWRRRPRRGLAAHPADGARRAAHRAARRARRWSCAASGSRSAHAAAYLVAAGHRRGQPRRRPARLGRRRAAAGHRRRPAGHGAVTRGR